MQAVLREALQAAAQIGLDIHNASAFDRAAGRTGRVFLSGSCHTKAINETFFRSGRFAITSTLLILRGQDVWLGVAGPELRVDAPIHTFRYREIAIQRNGFTRRGVEFTHNGRAYQIIDINRQRFADAVGAARDRRG